jgi:hypothetical protein
MIGITTDSVFGQHTDEETTRLIANVTIKSFRLRSPATLLHKYKPLVALVEKMVWAVPCFLLSVLRPLGVSS